MTVEVKKFEFCSSTWVQMLREYINQQSEGADLKGVSCSFNEVFTDPPRHLDVNGAGKIGWYLKVANGRAEVGEGVLPGADLRITADYQTILPLARTVFAGNPEGAQAAAKAVAAATESGKMKREGNDAAMAGLTWMGNLHDALAAKTL